MNLSMTGSWRIRRAEGGAHLSPTNYDEFEVSAPGRRWLSAFSVGIVGLYALHWIVFFGQTGPQDGDQYLVFHTLQYWNASLFGLAKQWTPLMCAGLSLAGEPQVPFMSFSMVLSYLLGPLLGVRIATIVYLILGWCGAYLYAGLWLRYRAQCVLAASLFIGNGFFICRLGLGHLDFVPFLILPIALWAIHKVQEAPAHLTSLGAILRFVLTASLMGASFALVIDGSPVSIIHLLFWIGLYALVLTVTVRSFLPLTLFLCSVAIAGVLDAGYLWPMLQAQETYPRLTANRFTSVFSFLWFAILPLRGKVLPANGNGHELSVFVGPVIGYLLWRYRVWLAASLPAPMKLPLVVVSAVSLVLGMGSLKVLHVPLWLSPFDLLRPLPGFRSIGVTGRYWGFLALPLSLLGAAALWKYVLESRVSWRMHCMLGSALLLQLAFQGDTLSDHWLHSRPYQALLPGNYFRHGPEVIEYAAIRETQMQGEIMSPTRGVSNCYDMDDFRRAAVIPGDGLVDRLVQPWRGTGAQPAAHVLFPSWSQLLVQIDCPGGNSRSSCLGSESSRTQLVLRQAYHEFWKAPGCNTSADSRGNLVLNCPASAFRHGTISATFDAPISDLGAHFSRWSWMVLIGIIGALGLIFRWIPMQRGQPSVGRAGDLVPDGLPP
jgi:hypothetical protein